MKKKMNITIKKDGNFTEVHISGYDGPVMRAVVKMILNVGVFADKVCGLFETDNK